MQTNRITRRGRVESEIYMPVFIELYSVFSRVSHSLDFQILYCNTWKYYTRYCISCGVGGWSRSSGIFGEAKILKD